jgi:alkaline phosphatase D
MMGRTQLDWLKEGLLKSTATWKVVSTHDPLSIVSGGPGDYDSFGTNDTAVLGREFELKELLGFMKDMDIRNVVYLTSDVHYAAAIKYTPRKPKAFQILTHFTSLQ